MKSAVAGYLALTLMFGDAVRKATPRQRERIEREIMPLFEDLKEADITKARERQLLERIVYTLMSTMGDTWKLDDEVAKWIDTLLGRFHR